MQLMNKRVLLWMSGWIDSTVCAYLLKEQGYDVVWVFMRYWVDPSQNTWIEKEDKISENKCCSLEAQMAANKTCDKLWIEFHVLNVRDRFFEEVVKFFLEIHKKWLTPNPCIRCNQKIKWWDILAKLKNFNCDFIATGHYANVQEKDWKLYAKEGVDKKKDQSYFMSVLSHEDLKKVIFPFWEMTKDETKKLAKRYWEEEVFKKKESQWVCFFSEDSYIPFLKRNLPEIFKVWEFIFTDEFWNQRVAGEHKWLPFYTIGQRKWLPWGFETAIYVTGFNWEKNQVLLWYDEDLWKKEIVIVDTHFSDEMHSLIWKKLKSWYLKVRIRHLGGLVEVFKIERHDINIENWKLKTENWKLKNTNFYKIILKTPIRAVTPGQYAVFYSEDERVLGNGMII